MSSNAIKVIAAIFVVLALVLAFFGFRMSRNYADTGSGGAAANAAAQQPAGPPQTQVVVAVRPLLADQPIPKEAVALEPVSVTPHDYFQNVDDVVGRIPLLDIDTGTPVTPRFFKEKSQIAALIPPGHQAVSLALTDVIGAGGFVVPGDIVDVLLYLRNDQANKVDPSQARILLKDALVLAFDGRVIAPPVDDDKNVKQQQQQQVHHERTVVVAVPEDQVTRVMLGASMGELRIALHRQEPTLAANAPSPAAESGATAPAAEAMVAETGAGPDRSTPAKLPIGENTLPDLPMNSADLALLKKKVRKNEGAPVGIILYAGGKRSTVYP